MYVKFNGLQVVKFPYSFYDFGNDNPNIDSGGRMPPDDELAEYNVARLLELPPPEHNPYTQKAEITGCEFKNGQWVTVWTVRDMTAGEFEATVNAIKQAITDATQARLDAFAFTRGYDDIKSAADYAGDEDAVFNAEGTYCKSLRSRTWRALINIMEEVKAGTRPMPTSFADVEAELPPMEWPT